MIFEYLFVFVLILISIVWIPMVLYGVTKPLIEQYKNGQTIDAIISDIIGILMVEVVIFILLYNHIMEIIHNF